MHRVSGNTESFSGLASEGSFVSEDEVEVLPHGAGLQAGPCDFVSHQLR